MYIIFEFLFLVDNIPHATVVAFMKKNLFHDQHQLMLGQDDLFLTVTYGQRPAIECSDRGDGITYCRANIEYIEFDHYAWVSYC